MAIGLAASSESVAKAAAWARPRLGDGIGEKELARHVGSRRGHSPVASPRRRTFPLFSSCNG